MSKRNYFITKEEAKKSIERFSTVSQRQDPNFSWGILFPLEVLEQFIANAKANPAEKVDHVRIYFAKTDNQKNDVILVGTSGQFKDVPDLNIETKNLLDGGDNIVGNGLPCPNTCGDSITKMLVCS